MQIATMCVRVLHFILHACVKLYTRVHVWSDATHVFCICTRVRHLCHIPVTRMDR